MYTIHFSFFFRKIKIFGAVQRFGGSLVRSRIVCVKKLACHMIAFNGNSIVKIAERFLLLPNNSTGIIKARGKDDDLASMAIGEKKE